jgi:hypothetical protein
MEVWKPFPKQEEALVRREYEVLFGGSRGPGKTDAGIVWLLGEEYEPGKLLIHHPRYRALILRKNFSDLTDWIDRASRMYKSLGGVHVGDEFRWPSGATFRLGHLKDRKSYEKYLGHEYQRILIEELTLIPQERYYVEILGSCRSTIPDIPPQVFATTNPGGIGHGWVKRRFISPSPWGKPFIGEDGRSRIFIHATVDDNPRIKELDPDYIRYLDGLRKIDLALWKAWRLGDWDSFVGQAFMEWQHAKHVTRSFDYPIEQFTKKIIGFDWGYSDPGAASWIGICPENEYGISRVYCYREIYQNKAKPGDWAKDIEFFTKQEKVDYIVLPHDCFASIAGGNSIAEIFSNIQNGNGKIRIEKGRTLERGARLNRKALLHEYLADAADGKPWLQIHELCINHIRTIPELVLDETNPEDIDTDGEDHAYDALTIALLSIGKRPGQSGGIRQHKTTRPRTIITTPSGEYTNQDFWELFNSPKKKFKIPEAK